MKNYEISVWVPTKGWKSVRKTTSAKVAYDLASSLLPLEVKVVESGPGGRYFYGGLCCMPAEWAWGMNRDGNLLGLMTTVPA